MSTYDSTRTASHGEHVAVLIDGDNISSKNIAGLMHEVASYGTVSVRRVYGDWSSTHLQGWSGCLLEHSIIPIQQHAYSSGKNATDVAMVIDAMDLLYTGRFASFCLVSSDSDFTRLAARIREQGVTVYGFGNRHNTHKAFVAACSSFVYLDALDQQEDEVKDLAAQSPLDAPTVESAGGEPTGSEIQTVASSSNQAIPTGPRALRHGALLPYRAQAPRTFHRPSKRPLDRDSIDAIRQAISRSNVYEDDFVNMAEVGIHLTKISPDINARNYGYDRASDFVKASGIVDYRLKSREPAAPIALVRLKLGV